MEAELWNDKSQYMSRVETEVPSSYLKVTQYSKCGSGTAELKTKNIPCAEAELRNLKSQHIPYVEAEQ